MRKIIAFTLFAILSAGQTTHSATTTGGLVGCITEEKLDEFVSASVQKDYDGMKYLLNNGCVVTKKGLKLSVLKRSWTVSKVRVYVNDNVVVLWTPNENISE